LKLQQNLASNEDTCTILWGFKSEVVKLVENKAFWWILILMLVTKAVCGLFRSIQWLIQFGRCFSSQFFYAGTKSLCRKNQGWSRNDEIVDEHVCEACRENYLKATRSFRVDSRCEKRNLNWIDSVYQDHLIVRYWKIIFTYGLSKKILPYA